MTERKIQGGVAPGCCWVCAVLAGRRGPAQWLLRKHLEREWG